MLAFERTAIANNACMRKTHVAMINASSSLKISLINYESLTEGMKREDLCLRKGYGWQYIYIGSSASILGNDISKWRERGP